MTASENAKWTREQIKRAAKAAWVARQEDQAWARAVVDDVFSPADDWPEDALDAERVAIAVLDSMGSAVDQEWEYGREYYDFDGSPMRRKVSKEEHERHEPDGHRSDGSPYWNYTPIRRRKAGSWGPVDFGAGK